MNKEYFVLNENSKVFIYGAATTGKLIFEKLKNNNFNVVGFIDKDYEIIKVHCGIPVFGLQTNNENNNVIIVAVKNVFEHSRIASKLKRQGWNNIFYRPYNALSGVASGEEKLLNYFYDVITGDNPTLLFNEKIPILSSANNILDNLTTDGIIDIESSTDKVVFIPSTMLFTDKKNNSTELPVLLLKPHLNFVKFIIGDKDGEYESYLNYCINAAIKIGDVKISDSWKRNVIRNRFEVFSNMKHRLDIDFNFFVINAPRVKWNDQKSYFNLMSGKHRTSFLIGCGNNYIPVRVTTSDLNCYLNYIDINKINNIFNKDYEVGFYPIIEHPYCISLSWINEAFWFGLVNTITSYLNKKYYINEDHNYLLNKKFYIDNIEAAFITRFLTKSGAIIVEKASEADCSITWNKIVSTGLNFLISKENSIINYQVLISTLFNGELLNIFVRDNNDYLQQN